MTSESRFTVLARPALSILALLAVGVASPSLGQDQSQPSDSGVQAETEGAGAAREGEDHGEFSSSPAAPDTEAAVNGAEYWTNQRLREAEPIELPGPESPGPQGLPEGAEIEAPELTEQFREEEGEPGSPPEVDPGDELRRQLDYDPEHDEAAMPQDETEATSTFGAYFTSKRVAPDAATVAYPYRTVGKLFFRDPRRNTNHVCSAAVLRPRLVATAGHCVSSPSPNAADRYFYTNFLFVPAFNNGAAPYGTWTSVQQWVSNEWFHSNGSVPNSGDIAIMIMRDQSINNTPRTIGSVTGWLGWQTNALSRNHLTLLGYPCNLDSCAKMQETNAGSFAAGGNNTYIYGSAGRGGHSGGPWVQDFGVAPAGATPNLLGLNRLVGITSYGPVSTDPKYLGASNLGQNFINLLNAACNASNGNC